MAESSKIYEKNVSEPWFSFILYKEKTIEGRLNKGDFAEIRIDDIIKWTHGKRFCKTKIIGLRYYKSFYTYLKSEKLKKCLPGIKKYKDGEKIYYSFYTKDDEKKYGVIAIELQIL